MNSAAEHAIRVQTLRAKRQEVSHALFEKLEAERGDDTLRLVKARRRLAARCREYTALVNAAKRETYDALWNTATSGDTRTPTRRKA